MDIKATIEEKISTLLRENQTIKNELEETVRKEEKNIDEIFCEFLTVIDTFERAEQSIHEKGLISDDNVQKVMNRLLNAKKKALHVLEKYNIKKVEFEGNHLIPDLCEVTAV